MALSGFKAFSSEEVVFVKENLLRGVTVADIARHFGVSGETISKIKRGLTYTTVYVPGEEALRPQSPLGERNRPLGPVQQAPRHQTEEELDAKVAESLKALKAMGIEVPDTPMD